MTRLSSTGRGKVRERAEVERLVAKLFKRVQSAQGWAFASDGETFATKEEFFARLRGKLAWTYESAKILRAFLIEFAGPRRPVRRGK